MSSVVPYSELERMRLSVMPEKPMDHGEKARRARKQLSEDRKGRWPNTLDAIREQKDRAMKEREDILEAERQEVDRKEAMLQKKKRMAAIERANMLLYEQTDKMKNLRSQQLYADVLNDREYQVNEKNKRANMEKERDEKYLNIQAMLLSEGDRKEEIEIKKRSEKNALIARQQQDQLEEFKCTYINQLKGEKREGGMIKRKVADDLVKEKEEAARRRREAKQAAIDTKIANEQLKQIRLERLKEEEKEEDKRQKEAEHKEFLMQRREKQEQLRFEEKLRIKQVMIDKATKQLLDLKNSNDNREENQAQEVRAAEDAEMERRRQRREKQQQAIDRSRQMQLDMRTQKKTRESDANQQMAVHWRERNEQVEEEEQAEDMERVNRNVKVKNYLKRQMDEKRRIKMEDRAMQLMSDQETKKMMDEEDARYVKLASAELEGAAMEGKNTIPLAKAMLAKDKTIMAVGGIRV
jgi:hypothetical protein